MPAKRPVLALVGADGMLARAIQRQAEAWEIQPLGLPDFDLANRTQVVDTLTALRPAVIINCAAYTAVDACETEEALARQVNGEGPGYLAEAAAEVEATLVHVSTDYVFDGLQQTPYREDDLTAPRSAYGRSKLLGEQRISASGLERYFIIRTSWLYGPGGNNFVETMLRLATEREELQVVADQVGSPTYTDDLAAAIFRLLALDGGYGLYHFSGAGQCSWYEFACAIVEEGRAAGVPLRVQRVVPTRAADYPRPAPRPAWSVLSKDKYRAATGAGVPFWRESLKAYLAERQQPSA